MNIVTSEGWIMEPQDRAPTRDGRGRGVAGVSGNRAGKPAGPGRRNFRLRDVVSDADLERMMRRIVGDARNGDPQALRFILGRIGVRPRRR